MQTIHILNGQEMYNHFTNIQLLEREAMLPFNEAMCDGETCSDIFSEQFVRLRANVHEVTTAEYENITMKPLERLWHRQFSRVVLWFDSDMFCQINLLTVLAWLDQVHYAGDAQLHLVDAHFQVIDKFSLNVKGYKALYDEVLINQKPPQHIEPAPLRNGVKLYLKYTEPESDLMSYIAQQQDISKQQLIEYLLKNFKHYGLGDIQYAKLIDRVRA